MVTIGHTVGALFAVNQSVQNIGILASTSMNRFANMARMHLTDNHSAKSF